MNSKNLLRVTLSSLILLSASIQLPALAADQTADKTAESADAQAAPQAEPQANDGAAEFNAAASEIEDLVKGYYPKATVTKTPTALEISFKCKKLNEGFTSSRTILAPQLDGILLKVEPKKGRYTGKETLPFRTNELLFVDLLIAPYSVQNDQHLLTHVKFPHNTPEEFISAFQTLMKKFDHSAEAKASTKTADSQTGGSEKTAAATTSSGSSETTNGDADSVSAVDATSKLASPAEDSDSKKLDFGEAKMSLYTFNDGRFQIKLPGSPTVTTKIHKGIAFRNYKYREPQGTYNIGYAVLSNPVRVAVQDKVITDLVNNISQASKGKASNLVSLPWNGYTGRQVDIKDIPGKPPTNSRLRAILVRRYLYVIEATGTTAWLKSPAAQQVLDSLVIRPELTKGETQALALQAIQREMHRKEAEAESRERNERPTYDKAYEKRRADREYGRRSSNSHW